MAKTVVDTLSTSLKISKHHMTAGLDRVVTAFTERDREMVALIETALADEGQVTALLVEHGYL